MSIETAVSREARAHRRGSRSLPSCSHAAGTPSPAGTVGPGPNGTITPSGRLARLLGRRGRRVELGEELVSGGLPLALGAPHYAAFTVIADQREVAVALAPRDLVDRDLEQVVESVGGQQFVADALDDPPDRLPVDPHQPATCAPCTGQRSRRSRARTSSRQRPRSTARQTES